LHPEVVAMLAAQAGGKSRAEMDVVETREAVRAGRRWQQEPAQVSVEDSLVEGVRVRFYGEASPVTVLYFHGGRFFSGDLESHDWPLRDLASSSGARICAVDYRLAPEYPYPAAVDDARAVRDGLKPAVVMGDSAGGYLAARVAGDAKLAVVIYPMLDATCSSRSYKDFWQSPLPNGFDMHRGWQLWGGEPPIPVVNTKTLLVTAGHDSLLDEALALPAAEHLHFPDMHHGFFTQTKLTRSRELMALIAARLRSLY
jgi:acetyl esterase